MKIVELRVENVKRIAVVTIKPDGSLVVIGGDNGAGKSSILDSIAMLLLGRGTIPDVPVRKGEERASIYGDLGDIKVERKFTAKGGGSLVVTGADGEKVRSPQALLDSLVSHLAFDPLAFSRMKPPEQLQALRDLVGLDLSALDQEHERVFAERTDVNRDVRRLEGQLSGLPYHEDAPTAMVSAEALVQQLTAGEAAQRQIVEAESWIRNAEREIERWDGDLETMRAEKAELERAISQKTDDIDAHSRNVEEKRAANEQARADLLPLQPLRDQIAAADGRNQKLRENKGRARVNEDLTKARAAADEKTRRLEAVGETKRQAIAGAEFPVPGLSMEAGTILLGGIPFDQASSAEQLRVSAAMGLAANPDLPVMLIREGSLLDQKSLAMLGEMAAKVKDGQVWIERVQVDEKTSIVIEDGMVAEAEPQAAAS